MVSDKGIFVDDQRKTDLGAHTKYRTSRFMKDVEKWYFFTREGTMEGPFGIKHEAEYRLETYKRVWLLVSCR